MAKIISSAELKKDRSIYNYKTKWSKKTIKLEDEISIQKLASEIDMIVSDNDRNEKIGFMFRTSKVEGDITTVMDISPIIERNTDDSLLDGKNFLYYAKQYAEYVKNTKELNNLKSEVMYYYYALDLKSGKEEMLEGDFLVQRSFPLNANEQNNLALANRLETLDLIANKIHQSQEDLPRKTKKPK